MPTYHHNKPRLVERIEDYIIVGNNVLSIILGIILYCEGNFFNQEENYNGLERIDNIFTILSFSTIIWAFLMSTVLTILIYLLALCCFNTKADAILGYISIFYSIFLHSLYIVLIILAIWIFSTSQNPGDA